MTAFAALVRETPLVPSPIGWLKLESLQRTGSFKLRGACLRLDELTDEERRRGVVAASAGNHGMGVALAGRTLGISVEVVVPAHCPSVKRRGIEALGAKVIEGGPGYDDAEAFARSRAVENGKSFVSPFDDPHVMRGNGGTLAEEILRQRPSVKRIVCPVGGGGMIAGIAAVLPREIELVGVQPEANCAMHDSLAQGRALTKYDGKPTLAEGCEGSVAESTYAACKARGVTIRLVSEKQIEQAIAYAYRTLGQLVEASAAVAIAGSPGGNETVVIVTGGNVEPDLVDRCLRQRQG